MLCVEKAKEQIDYPTVDFRSVMLYSSKITITETEFV